MANKQSQSNCKALHQAKIPHIDHSELEAEQMAYQVVLGGGTLAAENLNCLRFSGKEYRSGAVSSCIQRLAAGISREPGVPLQASVCAFMEAQFSFDFSSVRLHTSGYAQVLAGLLHAQAFTWGNHIGFAKGKYSPTGIAGKILLAHELTHVVQQRSTNTIRLQLFEAAVHESIEQYALTRGEKCLTHEEARAIYFGNWMRDYNQVFVPLVNKIGNASSLLSCLINPDNMFLFINQLAYQKFRRRLTLEQFGYYIPTEHLDSPAGLIKKLDLLDRQPKLSSEALNPESATIYEPRPPDLDTPQDEVDPKSVVSNNSPAIKCCIFDYDQTATMAFLRKTNIHVEKRLHLAIIRGRNADGMMHLGAALHAIEDLYGHSNWVEIAVNKLLNDDPTLLPELKGTARKVFTYSAHVKIADKEKPILTTGSFISSDTVISLHSELNNNLAKGAPPFKTNEERKADAQFTENMLKIFCEKFKKDPEFRQAVKNTAFYKSVDKNVKTMPFMNNQNTDYILENLHNIYIKLIIMPDFIREPIDEIIRILKDFLMKMCLPMALAYGVGSRVSDTSLIINFRENQRIANGKFHESEIVAMKTKVKLLGGKVDTLMTEAKNEASARVNNLQNTPDKVVAAPSHSQVCKDHINTVFFGISFYITTVAEQRLLPKIIAAWEEQSPLYKNPYRFTGEEADPSLLEENQKASVRAERIIKYGGDIPPDYYNLTKGRQNAVESIRSTASVLNSTASSPKTSAEKLKIMHDHVSTLLKDTIGPFMPDETIPTLIENTQAVFLFAASIPRSVDQKAVDEQKVLKDTAKELNRIADMIEKAETLEQREQASNALKKCRDDAFDKLIQTKSPDAAFYSAILAGIDIHLTVTAVAYPSEQRRVLEGKQSIPELKVSLQAARVELPPVQTKAKAEKELLEESRLLLSHPLLNDWWVEPLRSYIQKNSEQMKWEIQARNDGYPVYKMPSKEEYEALQKSRS